MTLYKRGGIWWYKFNVQGLTVRESSGLTNKDAARAAEDKRHTALRESRAGITPRERVPVFPVAADVWLKAKRDEWAASSSFRRPGKAPGRSRFSIQRNCRRRLCSYSSALGLFRQWWRSVVLRLE